MYDNDNIFAKIARGEIPCDVVVENEHALSFYDINPMFQTHVLVIPRGPYENILDFVTNAPAAAQRGFWDCFAQTTQKLGISGDFNIMANSGAAAPFFEQSVFHFHLHLMAGQRNDEFYNLVRRLCN